MKSHTLNCEVLTPLFLGGANPRNDPPGLRPPSFRGAMRFWYRALIGGSASSRGKGLLETLHPNEEEIFGSTERGSALSLRLSPNAPPSELYQKDRAIRTPTGDYLPSGKDYLLWSMYSSGKPGTSRFQQARAFIPPGTSFQVRLSSRLNEGALNMGMAAFWLLSNLGAVGARARRCAGSFLALGEDLSLPFRICDSISTLQEHLHGGLGKCLQLIGSEGWRDLPKSIFPEYEILHPQASLIWVVSGNRKWNKYQQALEGLGQALRDFRSRLGPLGKHDHDAVLHWFASGAGDPPTLKRPVFGLPIPFSYSAGGPSDVIISTTGDRRSSPLHMRVTRLSNGHYVGVLTLFKTQFLPDKAALRLQERNWRAPSPENYEVIEDFIQTFPVREQVTL